MLPSDLLCDILQYSRGIALFRNRRISKYMRDVIDTNASALYFVRMQVEFPRTFNQYHYICPYRTDWRNVYIITDQYLLSKHYAKNYKEILEARERFLFFEKLSITVELILGFLSASISIAKVAHFGWSGTRELLKAWMAENPGKTITDAFVALGLKAPAPITMPDLL